MLPKSSVFTCSRWPANMILATGNTYNSFTLIIIADATVHYIGFHLVKRNMDRTLNFTQQQGPFLHQGHAERQGQDERGRRHCEQRGPPDQQLSHVRRQRSQRQAVSGQVRSLDTTAFSLIRPSNLGIFITQVLWKQLPPTAEYQEELGPGEYYQPLPQRWGHRTRVLH